MGYWYFDSEMGSWDLGQIMAFLHLIIWGSWGSDFDADLYYDEIHE